MTVSRCRICSATTKAQRGNLEDNRDGANENHSTNCGHEGPTDDPTITALAASCEKQLACLLLAQGVPLVLAGDEVANSQSGNNNAYCQDNETGWINWDGLHREGDDLIDFIGQMTEIRKRFRSCVPSLARWPARRWILRRVWLTPAAEDMKEQDWNFPEGRFLLTCSDRSSREAADFIVLMPHPRRSRSNCRNCPNTRAAATIEHRGR